MDWHTCGTRPFQWKTFHVNSLPWTGRPPQGVIRALAEAENGDLWVGTGRGLFRIPSASLDDTEDVQATYYHLAGGTGDEITCLRFGPDGVLWVGTSRGLYRHRKGGFSLVLPNLSIIRLEETLGGHPLIISDQGFIEWDGMRKVDHRGLAASLSIHADQLFHVLEDHKGVDWFCTGNGLARRVGGAVKRFHPYGKGAPAHTEW